MAGILNWDLGDASNNVNANSLSHTYATGGIKNIKVYKGTADTSIYYISISGGLIGTFDLSTLRSLNNLQCPNNIKLTSVIFPIGSTVTWSYIDFGSCDITGTVDASGLSTLGGNFVFNNNSKLTKIINPTSSATFTTYQAQSCDLTGTLDLRTLSKVGRVINLQFNPKLNTILNPGASNTLFQSTGFAANNCGLMGTLDVSGYSRLAATFNVSANPSLNKIVCPSSNDAFTSFNISNCGLTGTLDISSLYKLGGSFRVNNNPNLNYIQNPSTNQIFTSWYGYSCGLMGTLDMSLMKNFGGDFQINNNPSLNTIRFPDSSQAFTYFYAYSCGLTGTLDVSNLTGFGGQVYINGNPNLTTILNPSSNKDVGAYMAYDCSLAGTLDLRPLKRLGGQFAGSVSLANNKNLNYVFFPDTSNRIGTLDLYNNGLYGTVDISCLRKLSNGIQFQLNPSLNNVIFPEYPNGGQYSSINFRGCDLHVDAVDNILKTLHTFFDASTPTLAGCSIDFSTGNNAYPTDGSANTDLVALVSLFGGLGKQFQITYNPLRVVDFSTGKYVNITSNVKIRGTKKVTWNMWLDVSYYSTYSPIICFDDGAATDTYVSYIYQDKFYIVPTVNSPFQGYSYDISTWAQKVLKMEMSKITGDISTLKIDGVLQAPSSIVSAMAQDNEFGFIGAPAYLKAGSIWNIKVWDTSSANINNIHWWRGDGSTNWSWRDLKGNAHGNVTGTPTIRVLPVP